MIGLAFGYPFELQHFMVNYDAIRLFAVVAIVVLHTAANGVTRLALGSPDWWLANLLDSAARAGVPLFLMLTGALLLNRPAEPAAQFYRRRFHKLGLPLLLWSGFYLIWSALKAKVKQQPYQLDQALDALLAGTPYFHLWFIFMLAGVYLVLPWLRLIWQPLCWRKRLLATCGALLLQQSLHLTAVSSGYWPALPWFCWFIAYLPYLFLGALLGQTTNKAADTPISASIRAPISAHHQSSQSRLTALLPQALLLLAFLTLTCITAWLYFSQQQLQQQIAPPPFLQPPFLQLWPDLASWLAQAPVAYAYHRLSLPVLGLAVLLWFLLGHNRLLARQSETVVGRFILKHSLGIYCVHPVLLDITTMALQKIGDGVIAYPLQLALQVSLILLGSALFCYLLAPIAARNARKTPSK